jgi:hypothetical protein
MASPDASRPLPTEGPTAGGDEFDDLFDYDVGGVNDPFSEQYNPPASKEKPEGNASKGNSGANLGIDEEVEVTRKPRAPRVKLDEHRYIVSQKSHSQTLIELQAALSKRHPKTTEESQRPPQIQRQRP